MKHLFLYKSVSALAFSTLAARSDHSEISPIDPAHNTEASASYSENMSDVLTNSLDSPLEIKSDQGAKVTRSADSHSHGDAQLAIVTIELVSPLYNILGFEHMPRTDALKSGARK